MPLTTREFRDRGSFPYLLLAAVTALVVVVIALALTFSPAGRPHSDESAAPAAPTSPAGDAVAPTVPKGSLVVPVPNTRAPSDPDWLTAAPQGISWQRVEGVPLPFTASDGPTAIDGAVASGYAHTPQGAVIAALQITMRMLYSPDYARIVAEQTVLPEPERQKVLAARAVNPRLDPVTVHAATVQPVAFKIGSYRDAAATVFYAYPRPDGMHRIARIAVAWADGDWRYTNTFDAEPQPDTADLAGFTRF